MRLMKQLFVMQRRIFAQVEDHGVTHDALAAHLQCSRSRVDFWTQVKGQRAMTLDGLLGLIELTGDPVTVLRPLLDACGLVVVQRPDACSTTDAQLVADMLTMSASPVQGVFATAIADGHLDADEAEAIDAQLQALIDRAQEMQSQLKSRGAGPLKVAR